MISIIKKYNLTHSEVKMVVNEWYTQGLYPDILQDERGRDLEEILDVATLINEEDFTIDGLITDYKSSMSLRCRNALRVFRSCYPDIEYLSEITREKFLRIRGCGVKSWSETQDLRGY